MTPHTLGQILTTPPLWLAFLFAAAFAGLAWQARLLTRNGALATFLVGFVIFGFGGGRFVIPLLVFFLTSSLLSRVGKGRKAVAKVHAVKGATRDAGQVWANGVVAAALVLIYAYAVRRAPFYETRPLLMLFLAALASVNADTWATELGALSNRAPRLLTNWRTVSPGTSGAITGLGLLAGLAGAVLIPLSALPFWHLDAVEFSTVAWAGFLGSLLDSILGAGVQVQYRDPKTGELTDHPQIEGHPTIRVRGLPWVTNDVVNFLASVGGVVCAWTLLHFSGYTFY